MSDAASQRAFDDIYRAESDAIFRFCLIRVSDREQALDLTQETFTRFWQAVLRGQEMTNARAFLFTVARHLIIDWYRKKKSVSLEAMSREDDDKPYDPVSETAARDLEQEVEGRFLIQSIGRLGSSYRQAVYLRFVEGLSPGEIGDILGISANAASVRVNRGVEELRKLTGHNRRKK
jgi:RNA polymerase sigma-70 factor (ECF subfamily)